MTWVGPEKTFFVEVTGEGRVRSPPLRLRLRRPATKTPKKTFLGGSVRVSEGGSDQKLFRGFGFTGERSGQVSASPTSSTKAGYEDSEKKLFGGEGLRVRGGKLFWEGRSP